MLGKQFCWRLYTGQHSVRLISWANNKLQTRRTMWDTDYKRSTWSTLETSESANGQNTSPEAELFGCILCWYTDANCN